MIEIVVMIGVIGWFVRTAKERGQRGWVWGLIGGLSFYVPVVCLGLFIFTAAVFKGYVTSDDDLALLGVELVLKLTVGAGCCYLARWWLLHHYQADMARIAAESEAAARARDLAGPSWGHEPQVAKWIADLKAKGYDVSVRSNGFAIRNSSATATDYVHSPEDLARYVKRGSMT